MDEKLTATLEKIQEAALTEFLDKGFLGASLAADREERRGDHWGVLRLFLQQGGPVRLHCEPHAKALMASSWRPRPPLQSYLRSSSRTTWGGVPPTAPLDGGSHLPAPGAGEAAPHPRRGYQL